MRLKYVLQKNWRQVALIAAAFLSMIVISYAFVSNILQNRINMNAHEILRTSEANVKIGLREPEVALVNVALAVRQKVNNGESQESILQYLTQITDWLLEDAARVSGFNGVYGVIRGEYLDGTRWMPPADYVPQERPWYVAAVNNNGRIVSTSPYVDAQTHNVVVSMAQEMYDANGGFIGILSIDVLIDDMMKEIRSLRLADGGYGLAVNQDFEVMAHKDMNLVGKSLREISKEYALLADALQAGSTSSFRWIHDVDGQEVIVFSRTIFNGWTLALIAPARSYFREVYEMAIVLSGVGAMLMILLSYLVLRLDAAQMSADEKSKSKSLFLARMSHEIRTPMNAIIGMSELAYRERDNPQSLTQYLQGIRQAGHNLLAIINDILDFSKIEAGSLQLNPAPYETASLLNDVLTIVNVRLEDKPVRLITDIDAAMPGVLIGDETRVRQILLNLLSNAAKYTREGFIKFSVRGEKSAQDSITLIFEVEDSGIGIKPEDMSGLFGDFVRVNEKRNRSIEGTGLGLSITRRLCRAMGGDVAVRSEYGKGSLFTATLVQKSADSTALGVMDRHAYGKRRGADSIRFTAPAARILIVDDIATNLQVASGLLAPYSMEIHTCMSGEEAVEMVKAHAYDLVLMDHMMPDVDGIEATARIRALPGERFRDLPIVMLTANAISGMRELFLSKGLDDFLAKPIEIAKLNELIEKWIPLEKKVKLVPAAPAGQAEETPAFSLKIDGLDTAAGLIATGGTEKGYLKVLELYRRDADERLAFLRNFAAEPDASPLSAISLFITQAHALKSASASIGAAEISRMAERLEEAGRCGDLQTIREQIDEFCESLSNVAERIREALDARAAETKKDGKAGVDAQTVQKLRQALLLQDVGTVDALIVELRKDALNARTEEVLTKIANAVLLAEYDEALTALDGLTED